MFPEQVGPIKRFLAILANILPPLTGSFLPKYFAMMPFPVSYQFMAIIRTPVTVRAFVLVLLLMDSLDVLREGEFLCESVATVLTFNWLS
ncbi:MAG: hypothetical protein MJE68_04180 [Proteobacteria bacterium]|nr:hypothetical protein [Pseudomonadota bacterium]